MERRITNVTVPNVLGMSESLASQTLDSANLKVTVKYETSSKAEYGTVTSQTPYSAGDSVPSGTTITIYVSHYQQSSTTQQTTKATERQQQQQIKQAINIIKQMDTAEYAGKNN